MFGMFCFCVLCVWAMSDSTSNDSPLITGRMNGWGYAVKNRYRMSWFSSPGKVEINSSWKLEEKVTTSRFLLNRLWSLHHCIHIIINVIVGQHLSWSQEISDFCVFVIPACFQTWCHNAVSLLNDLPCKELYNISNLGKRKLIFKSAWGWEWTRRMRVLLVEHPKAWSPLPLQSFNGHLLIVSGGRISSS